MGLPTTPEKSPNLPVKKIPVHIKVKILNKQPKKSSFKKKSNLNLKRLCIYIHSIHFSCIYLTSECNTCMK